MMAGADADAADAAEVVTGGAADAALTAPPPPPRACRDMATRRRQELAALQQRLDELQLEASAALRLNDRLKREAASLVVAADSAAMLGVLGVVGGRGAASAAVGEGVGGGGGANSSGWAAGTAGAATTPPLGAGGGGSEPWPASSNGTADAGATTGAAPPSSVKQESFEEEECDDDIEEEDAATTTTTTGADGGGGSTTLSAAAAAALAATTPPTLHRRSGSGRRLRRRRRRSAPPPPASAAALSPMVTATTTATAAAAAAAASSSPPGPSGGGGAFLGSSLCGATPAHAALLPTSIVGVLAAQSSLSSPSTGGEGDSSVSNGNTTNSNSKSADGGNSGSGNNGGDGSSSGSRLLARATAALDRLVTAKREAVESATVLDVVAVLRRFNTRVGHALWRASLLSSSPPPINSSSSSSTELLDAELSPLVVDLVAWLAALARYKMRFLRSVCLYDLDTNVPVAPGPADPEALEREDLELLAAARMAKFSRVQLQLLGYIYRSFLASARRADGALRAAAAALDAPAVGVAAAGIEGIERAMVESQAAVHVASFALFQVLNPRQLATMWAARHPRVMTSAALLRGAWLLLRAEEEEQ
jgi:hypothetical protein